MRKNNADSQRQNDGYNKIADMIQSAETVATLTKVIENTIPLIRQYGLDDYQTKRLEEQGYKQYGKIQNIQRSAFNDMIHNTKVS